MDYRLRYIYSLRDYVRIWGKRKFLHLLQNVYYSKVKNEIQMPMKKTPVSSILEK